jgi:hypothetical protein
VTAYDREVPKIDELPCLYHLYAKLDVACCNVVGFVFDIVFATTANDIEIKLLGDAIDLAAEVNPNSSFAVTLAPIVKLELELETWNLIK